ncbi:MAG: polysaccharide biosynthesis/export family protein [Bacteroidia bacterium]
MSFLIVSSCVSNKKYIYLQNKDKNTKTDSLQTIKVINDEYKLKPGDILYIRLVTEDDKMNALFNPNTSGNANMMMMQGGSNFGTPFYIMGYSLDKDGYLELPYIGKVNLLNKSVDETRKLLNIEVSKYFKNFYLQVVLAEFRFSILGSVYRPGQYFFSLNHVNIFQAISMAGDIQDIGKRTAITLIREENGKTNLIDLDLTDRNIINSPYYYIKPNDIIYVQPVKSRSIGRISNFQESLGAVLPIFSTFLLVLNTYIILQNLK